MLNNHDNNKLITANLDIITWIIRKYIRFDETVRGLEYDELFQEGCIYLCKAASSYDPDRAEFNTYAEKVVKNGLIDYCRKISAKNKTTILSLDNYIYPDQKDSVTFIDELADEFNFDALSSMIDVLSLLQELKAEYRGHGIEALEWKVKGFTVAEIAKMYGLKPNVVDSRIARAVKYLRKSEKLLKYFGKIPVEKNAA